MCKIPRIRGADVVAAFKKAGFYVDRIKGSHHIMKKDGHVERLSIPVKSGRTVGKGLLADQIDKAGLTVEEFKALL